MFGGKGTHAANARSMATKAGRKGEHPYYYYNPHNKAKNPHVQQKMATEQLLFLSYSKTLSETSNGHTKMIASEMFAFQDSLIHLPPALLIWGLSQHVLNEGGGNVDTFSTLSVPRQKQQLCCIL